VILLPQAWEERRDRAFVLAELGRAAQAADDLDTYLAQRPAAPDAAALRQRLAQWRAAGDRPLH
jgi:regulator of sirC expression with transglutaminase-like and TPR domain